MEGEKEGGRKGGREGEREGERVKAYRRSLSIHLCDSEDKGDTVNI